MIAVPDAGLFPRTPRPVRCENVSTISNGKPWGYVGKGCAVTTPMSSQWPAVVSLPFDRSKSFPAIAGAPGCGGQPCSFLTFPRPNASRFGRSSPPTAFATLPSVSEPSSPYAAASGSSPAPTASSTITHARGTRLSYGGLERRPGAHRNGHLHRRGDRPCRRRDVSDRPNLAVPAARERQE